MAEPMRDASDIAEPSRDEAQLEPQLKDEKWLSGQPRSDRPELTTSDLTRNATISPDKSGRIDQDRPDRPDRIESADRADRPKLVEQQESAQTANRTSAIESTQPMQLFSEPQLKDFRGRWSEIQTGFVDEPRRTVESADKLVASLMSQLAEGFANERARLERQWDHGENVSTEDMRLALQRYRSFFDRLLRAQEEPSKTSISSETSSEESFNRPKPAGNISPESTVPKAVNYSS